MSWEWGLLAYLGLVAVPNAIAVFFPPALTAMVVVTVLAYGLTIVALTRHAPSDPPVAA